MTDPYQIDPYVAVLAEIKARLAALDTNGRRIATRLDALFAALPSVLVAIPEAATSPKLGQLPDPLRVLAAESWLAHAMSLPGKGLHVAIRIWYEVGLAGSNEVSLSMIGLAELGISRFAASRGLRALEAAGLVAIARHAGRKPLITVLAYPRGPKREPS